MIVSFDDSPNLMLSYVAIASWLLVADFVYDYMVTPFWNSVFDPSEMILEKDGKKRPRIREGCKKNYLK